MKKFKCAGLLLLAVVLGGCATLKENVVFVHEGKLKNFEPDAARALVYVFRDKAFLGKNATSQLVVDNVSTVVTNPGEFSVVSVAPGKYEFLAYSSNESNAVSMMVHNRKREPIPLSVEAGRIYYFETTFSAMSGFSLKNVQADDIQPKIKKAKFNAFQKL
jgi:hypothetical protein